MKTMSDLLREQPFVEGLDDDIVTLIAGCAKNVSFRPDEYIFRHGEPSEHFYVLRHGTVALEMSAPGRGTFTFLTVKSGEILGASWLVPPYRWSYDARAVEVTRAIAFDCTCLRDKCEADHHVGYELMKCFLPTLVKRLQMARLQTADLYGDSSQ